MDALVEDLVSIDAVLREYDVAPPPLTTGGARSVLKRLTEAAEIDVGEGSLQRHGARRGMIGEVYKRDRGEAQDLGRHESMETTREAYCHLDGRRSARCRTYVGSLHESLNRMVSKQGLMLARRLASQPPRGPP